MVGMILEMQGRIPEAQKKYERAIEINPNAAVAANNLAWMYTGQNVNLDTALQLAQTAKLQLPDSAEVDDTLGWVYYKKSLSALAWAHLSAARPNNRPTRDTCITSAWLTPRTATTPRPARRWRRRSPRKATSKTRPRPGRFSQTRGRND